MKYRLTQMLQHIHGQPHHGQVKLPPSTENSLQNNKITEISENTNQRLEQIIREKDQEIECLRHALANNEARLQELMGTDLLTALPNRHVFKEHFTNSLKRALRLGYSLSLMLIDIDNMHDISLRHGHEVGDKVLIEVAQILRSSVREIDMPARWSDEELVAVLHETDVEGAAAVAERVRRRVVMLKMPDQRSGKLLSLTASLAVASYPKHSSEAQELLDMACEALLTAKEKGGNLVVIANH